MKMPKMSPIARMISITQAMYIQVAGGLNFAATKKPSGRRLALAFVFLAALIAALPVLSVFGSFPSGLISAFIIFIGMRQAWKMTGAPRFLILGPYRVGAVSAPASA